MPRLALSLLFALALAAPPAHAMWEGTWSTTHGELRIVSIGAFAVGDYAERGTLVGQVRGSRLTGTFTNGARAGRFDWTTDRRGAFSGSWHWVGETASGGWSGNRASAAEPALTNFARDGRGLRSTANNRDVYDGTYGGTFGEVRLRSRDLVLVGDYGDSGTIAGMWDGNGFVGTFTNGARAGWFDWEFLSRTGSFRSGQWGWAGEAASGAWTLNKTDGAVPRLTSLRPTAPAPEAEPAPYTRLQGAYLRRGRAFDLDKARTLVSMQEHVQWVSGDEATARRELAANGFTLHGGGFIDTEAGSLARVVTTGRLRAYVAHRGTDMVVVFRGSGGSNVWQTGGNAVITDLNIRKRRVDFIRNAPVLVSRDDPRRNARVHVGFADAYERLRPDIIAAVRANPDKNVYVFGHSLGGALSMLCAIDLATDRSRGIRSVTHISSGTPRVGNGDFRSLFESVVPNNLRMTVGLDPVPLIPVGVPARLARFSGRHYRHAGRLLPLSRGGVALRAREINTRLEGTDFDHHDNGVYLEVARSYLERVTQSGRFPYVDALGDAERDGAEAHAEAVLAAIPSLFD